MFTWCCSNPKVDTNDVPKEELDKFSSQFWKVIEDCKMEDIPVSKVLAAFKAKTTKGSLTKDAFGTAYAELLTANGKTAPDDELKAFVFKIFDKDGNGTVDGMELVCGVSLLAEGTSAEKVSAVFKAFDENSDGFISKDEMIKFLASVYKVLLTPEAIADMKSRGTEVDGPDDLAKETADSCFEECDVNKDGKLSIEEFRKWWDTDNA
jgi:Ca2+-binding EF-hand superfamily protein